MYFNLKKLQIDVAQRRIMTKNSPYSISSVKLTLCRLQHVLNSKIWLSLDNSYCSALYNFHLLNPLVFRLWTHWREDEPSVWWRRWMASACLRPPSPLVPPRFVPSPAPAQVSTDCLVDVRGSLWQRWALGPQQRWSRWVSRMRFTEQIKYIYIICMQCLQK